VIAVRDLSKEFNGFRALQGVNLHVSSGETFGLIGPNGAGKTTLVRILTGHVRATSGEIFFQGGPIDPRSRDYRLKIGLVPQEPAFYGRLSARENLRLIARLYGIDAVGAEEKAASLLEWSGLTEHADRQARFFSRGMQQRLSLAMGMLHDPKLLYLDEPTSGLDPEARISLWSLIMRLREGGTSIFITTHNMEEADRLCSRLAVLVSGCVREEGSPHEIKKLLGSERLELRLDPEGRGRLDDLCARLGLSWAEEGDRVIISGSELSHRLQDIVQALGSSIQDLRHRDVTLDDAFVKFMAEVRR
jgi:ABC-type multidrug transport system ATPase subunit